MLCLSTEAGDDLFGADDFAVLVDVLHELRDVVQDVETAHVLPHPAPHLHVGAQPLGGRAEVCRLSVSGKRREIELPQFLELRMLRVEAAQIGVGLVRCGKGFDHRLRVDPLRAPVEVRRQHCRGIGNAAAARVSRVKKSGCRVFDLGFGEGVRIGRSECAVVELRQLERAHVERVSPGVRYLGGKSFGLGLQAGSRHPKRIAVAGCVEFDERRLVFALMLVGGGRLRRELAASRIEDRVVRNCRRGRGGLRRRDGG